MLQWNRIHLELDPSFGGRRFGPWPRATIVIGSGPDADVLLTAAWGIADRHATLHASEKGARLFAEEGAFTQVDGADVPPGGALLLPGARVYLGTAQGPVLTVAVPSGQMSRRNGLTKAFRLALGAAVPVACLSSAGLAAYAVQSTRTFVRNASLAHVQGSALSAAADRSHEEAVRSAFSSPPQPLSNDEVDAWRAAGMTTSAIVLATWSSGPWVAVETEQGTPACGRGPLALDDVRAQRLGLSVQPTLWRPPFANPPILAELEAVAPKASWSTVPLSDGATCWVAEGADQRDDVAILAAHLGPDDGATPLFAAASGHRVRDESTLATFVGRAIAAQAGARVAAAQATATVAKCAAWAANDGPAGQEERDRCAVLAARASRGDPLRDLDSRVPDR